MQSYELSLQLAFSEETPLHLSSDKINRFILAAVSDRIRTLWIRRKIDGYVFNNPHPQETDRIYRPGKIYTIHIRTISRMIAELLAERLEYFATPEVQGLSLEAGILPRMQLYRIFSVTPLVLYTERGYWRNTMNAHQFENLIRTDLLQKYNGLHSVKLFGDFPIFSSLRIVNHKPIAVYDDGISLLGDRINIDVAPNWQAQELMYMALGMGIGERNAKGCGFMGYKMLKNWQEG